MGRSPGALAVFRPVTATIVAAVAGVAVTVECLWVAVSATGPLGSSPPTRATLGVVAACSLWLSWRVGAVRAVPTPAGLTVRNVGRSRVLEWAQVVSVRFGASDPWARLDLADGSSIAVLAVQRSDGRRAAREASRLAALVTAFGQAADR